MTLWLTVVRYVLHLHVSFAPDCPCHVQQVARSCNNARPSRVPFKCAASAAVLTKPAPAKPSMSKVEMWNGKRLQTQVLPLAEDTTCIRSLDWDRDRFDIEFG